MPNLSPAELAYMHTSLSSHPTPIRPDARSATAFRALSAETDVLAATTNGSAHLLGVGAGGCEVIVGVKAEVECTVATVSSESEIEQGLDGNKTPGGRGSADWVAVSLTVPGVRDDDAALVALAEMLRESLVVDNNPTAQNGKDRVPSLRDALAINARWHWRLFIDMLLISPGSSSSSGGGGQQSSTSTNANAASEIFAALPLLSLTAHLALRDTKLPKLKSQGEEDPLFDDDWEAAGWLYPRRANGSTSMLPPITLLVIVVGENVIFDPSAEELAVADGVVAVSVGCLEHSDGKGGSGEVTYGVLAVRMIDTPARDTMKGTPMTAAVGDGDVIVDEGDEAVPGLWKPKVGGIKRAALKKIIRCVLGEDGKGGVARDVIEGLHGFLKAEKTRDFGRG